MNNDKLAETLQQFFQKYLNAWVTQDLESVVSCYALPSTMTSGESIVPLYSNDAVAKQCQQIFDWMATTEVAGITVSNASYHAFNKEIAVVNIHWKFLDKSNNLITDFAALYHIQISEKHAKIMHVVSHPIAVSADLSQALSLNNLN